MFNQNLGNVTFSTLIIVNLFLMLLTENKQTKENMYFVITVNFWNILPTLEKEKTPEDVNREARETK